MKGVFMKIQSKFIQKVGITLLMSFSSTALLAAGIADVLIDSGGVSLTPTVSYDIAGLRVSGNNYDVTTEYTDGESIRIDAGNLADGVYAYELSLAMVASESAPNGSGVHQSGAFVVQGGSAMSISESEKQEEVASSAQAVDGDSHIPATDDL